MKIKITKDCPYSFNGSHVQILKKDSEHDLPSKDASIIVDDLKSGEIIREGIHEPIIPIESPAKAIQAPIVKVEPKVEPIDPTYKKLDNSQKKKNRKRKKGS